MTHRVAVMYLGKIVEVGRKREIFGAPKHPYTEALLSAVPVPEPGASRQRIILKGDVPSPINPPKGCRFHTRCPYVVERCRVEPPQLLADAAGHATACHRTAELPSSDAIMAADGFSPALERLVAAFSTPREAAGCSGVDRVRAMPPTVV
jgi:oligopeptide/dipeptide ABC transporter ATP-binding protein